MIKIFYICVKLLFYIINFVICHLLNNLFFKLFPYIGLAGLCGI